MTRGCRRKGGEGEKGKREATGRANAGGPAGFRARRWTGRGRRARTRRVQAAVREAAVQPLPPGKLLRRGEGGEGQRSSRRDGRGRNRGEGMEKEAPRCVAHHRLTPRDADRLVHEQPRGPDRDGRNRARRGARPRRILLAPRGDRHDVPAKGCARKATTARAAVSIRDHDQIAAARSRARRRGDGRIRRPSKASDATIPPKRERRTPRGERRDVPRKGSLLRASRRDRRARLPRVSHLFIGSRPRRPSRWTSSKS